MRSVDYIKFLPGRAAQCRSLLHECVVFYVKLTMPVAKLACDAQEPKDQAVLARQLPVQELTPRLATKGLRQAPGGLVQ